MLKRYTIVCKVRPVVFTYTIEAENTHEAYREAQQSATEAFIDVQDREGGDLFKVEITKEEDAYEEEHEDF